MLGDLGFIFKWWFVIFLLGTLSLPVVFLVFKNFLDKGYIFSKILSISVLTYLIFVFSSFKFLPFSNFSLYFILFLFLIFDIFFLLNKNKYRDFFNIFKKTYKFFIFEEFLFFLILTSWSFVRGFSPNIEGLEKFMDWGFINSALRSRFLPPVDMWFSGETINYYYFGHLMFAALTKLSSISSAITYNLSVATTCALTFVSGFSLVLNLIFIFLKKKLNLFLIFLPALISSLLLTFGGNLHTVFTIIRNNIKNEGKLVLTTEAILNASEGYWYPNATRFIGYDPDTTDKTIHEFPGYSFVVADLHGHMNDIAIVIFFMAFLFAFFIGDVSVLKWGLVVPSGFILSIAYMTNAWDFAVYGLLFTFFFFFVNLRNNNFQNAFFSVFLNGILTILFWFIFSLPFSSRFIPMAEGLRLSDAHSPFYQLFVLYGGFWLICLPFVVYLFYLLIQNSKLKIKNYISISDIFVLSLVITATLLVVIPEIFYIKDIYSFDYRRANTMFKLVYQAFIMYSLASGYILIRLLKSLKSCILSFVYTFIFLFIFISHMIYPIFSIKSFYNLKNYKGLWGLEFLKNDFSDNFSAIEWINKNIKGQPVMLEATGDSYTTFNQISVATGLPTVQGWLVHEWLWRGGYDKPGARVEDVRRIYESSNLEEVKNLVKKYSVEYIFVGSKEYEKYQQLNENNFSQIGKIIFQSGNTKIYKLN